MQSDDLSTAAIIPKFSTEISENDGRGRGPYLEIKLYYGDHHDCPRSDERI